MAASTQSTSEMALKIPQSHNLCRLILALIIVILVTSTSIYLVPGPSPGPYQQPVKSFPGDQPPAKVDVPYQHDPAFRLSLNRIGNTNTVFCWPSVGGIIIAPKVTPVELDFLSVPRFTPVLRPEPGRNNTPTEDAFCRRLRLLGATWYKNYWDYLGPQEVLFRPTTPEEDEILHLGWPEDGQGVWVLRQKDENELWEGMWRFRLLCLLFPGNMVRIAANFMLIFGPSLTLEPVRVALLVFTRQFTLQLCPRTWIGRTSMRRAYEEPLIYWLVRHVS